MANSKKYSYQLEQTDALWTAQIIRKASSKLFIVSKEQVGFATEAEAKEWAEKTLLEFTSTLSSSNQRHGDQRKSNEEERLQRSARRSERTLLAKKEKAEQEQALADETAENPDNIDEID